MPKFEVGEVVILQSQDHPEMNGEDTISRITRKGEVFECPHSLYLFQEDKDVRYFLDRAVMLEPHKDGMTDCGWAEHVIKKKHNPASLSFRNLIQTLKDPSKCQNA